MLLLKQIKLYEKIKGIKYITYTFLPAENAWLVEFNDGSKVVMSERE